MAPDSRLDEIAERHTTLVEIRQEDHFSCKVATIEARHAERLGHVKPELLREVTDVDRGYLGLG